MLSKQLDIIVSSLTPEDQKATLSTLRKIFDNIIQHPNDDKYRQIKLANKIFSSKVWRHPACKELIKMSGWAVDDDCVRLRDDSHVHIVSQLLDRLSGQENVQVLSSGYRITKCLVDEYEAIILAVVKDDISSIQNLLKPAYISTDGIIHCENGSSANLLFSAILSQKIGVVELLVKQYSVDPYITNDKSRVMIFKVFSWAPQSFIIDFLRCCGVKASFKDSGFTLLHIAVFANCFHVVCFLVEKCGVDVNVHEDDFNTPLHYAYMAGHTHIAEYLIQHGADVMAVNRNGNTPYQLIDGIPEVIRTSQEIQTLRKIHKVPGSGEYLHYIKLRNLGMTFNEAITLTVEQFPSLTEDGLHAGKVSSHLNPASQPYHDIDHASFTKELMQYITKRSLTDQPWGSLKSKQTRHLQFML